MAPFKLKFRMGGGSRSTSQEHDPDPQVNEALLNHHQQQQHGTSSSTLDSADCTSVTSLGANSERRSLLPSSSATNKTNNFRLGYLNQSSVKETVNTTDATIVPSTPPPSYEHVLEELHNSHLTSQYGQSPQRQIETHGSAENSRRHSRRSSTNSLQTNPLDQIYELETCNDPNCEENIAYNERQRLQREQEATFGEDCNRLDYGSGSGDRRSHDNINEIRKNSINSSEYLLSTNMTAPASEEDLLNNCNGDCQHYEREECQHVDCGGSGRGRGASGGSGINHDGSATGRNDFYDPLMNHNDYYDEEPHTHDQHTAETSRQEDNWHHSRQSQQSGQQQMQQQSTVRHAGALTPEIMISNKSSKEIYKDLAKQWGITCKMSDGCRCMECQSHYFDCEFDDNEHQKTDGGLGAGTPMFISEVMHGSACQIL